MKIRYCIKCVIPSTKPYISFNEDGVCNACLAHEKKRKAINGINWSERKKEFLRLISYAKNKNAPFYDVLVPVSGGKDSITQVHRLQGSGLRILAVNIDYGIKTDIGRYNLDLIPHMGAHLITYRPEQKLHWKLIKIGLEDFGDPDLLSHTLLHAYPLRVALAFKIPLVLLGENSAFEYGGEASIASRNNISREWFDKYAANCGHNAKFISKKYDIPFEDLVLYDFPDGLERSDTKAIFLSQYFYWDSERHLKIAKSHGFKTLKTNNEGTYRNYVGIDEKINRIHQYIKVLKFGYGRATDHACEDIRNGKLKREEAKKLVKKYDLQDISDYYIDEFIKCMGYSKKHFISIMEKYRNRDIWKKDRSGKWFISGHLTD